MQDQNHDQSQPTNPARARRKWLRWLAVPAAVAILALIYQLTRPPELVCWRSPQIGTTHRRVRILVPTAWEAKRLSPSPGPTQFYEIGPIDRRPALIRRLFGIVDEQSSLMIFVYKSTVREAMREQPPHKSEHITREKRFYVASFVTMARGAAAGKVDVDYAYYYPSVLYQRTNRSAFNRTYRQICDSLTIE